MVKLVVRNPLFGKNPWRPRRDLNPCYRRERTKGLESIQYDCAWSSVTKSNGHKGASRIGNQRILLSDTVGRHRFGTEDGTSLAPELGTACPPLSPHGDQRLL